MTRFASRNPRSALDGLFVTGALRAGGHLTQGRLLVQAGETGVLLTIDNRPMLALARFADGWRFYAPANHPAHLEVANPPPPDPDPPPLVRWGQGSSERRITEADLRRIMARRPGGFRRVLAWLGLATDDRWPEPPQTREGTS